MSYYPDPYAQQYYGGYDPYGGQLSPKEQKKADKLAKKEQKRQLKEAKKAAKADKYSLYNYGAQQPAYGGGYC